MNTKILVIDDFTDFLQAVRLIFSTKPEVVAVECHSMEDALAAIDHHQPRVIFLDHNLSPNGGEGLRIVNELRKRDLRVRVYSTTDLKDATVVNEYKILGIEVVGKASFRPLTRVIEETV